MKRLIYKPISYLFIPIAAFLILFLSGCDDESEPTEIRQFETSILLYAVASNNLSYNFSDDMEEIRTAASSINLDEADIIVYSVTNSGNPTMSRLVKNEDDTYGFQVIKEYDREVFSTDPQRISAVIEDYIGFSTAPKRGLILWSHATGWTPTFDDHIVPQDTDSDASSSATTNSSRSESSQSIDIVASGITPEMNLSFGQDKYNGVSDHCDIIELADAIPDNTFDFIWFDCCYMSQIEVFYQLRNKANYFIASPNELAAEGMPYQLTMPLIAKKNYSLYEAVDTESTYFADKNVVYAMALVDASALEDVATAAQKVVNERRPSTSGLQRYNTSGFGPFFDFGQYIRNWGVYNNEDWDSSEFDAAMDKLVVYKSASSKNWDNNLIREENFSGIGTHFFYEDDTEESQYYKQLDWFKRFYTVIPD